MKNILIAGANSYIGTSFEKWMSKWVDRYSIDILDLTDISWKEKNFSKYDVVLHVAGIAHIKETNENKELYYKVNRDLANEVAQKAKVEGVKQFIFLSSMSVYGIDSGIINKDSVAIPKSNYGKSKLEAEKLILSMQDNNFNIAILRPPMVYGKGCKGNYNKLSKLAKSIPVFPDIRNRKSMIFIDNLCEYIRGLIDNYSNGIFFPQNGEYVCTSDMVKLIAKIHGKNIKFLKLFNPIIRFLSRRINTLNKAFGSLVYDKNINSIDYKNETFSFKKSIELTESKTKKIVILTNHHLYTYNFRKEIIKELINEGYKTYIILPYGEKVEQLKDMGCEFIDLPIDRRGMNPIKDLKLFLSYKKIIKNIKPEVVLSYTIKPNVYGGIACRITKTPYIANVTGLGTSIESNGLMQKIILKLYKEGLKKANCVFFQNEPNRKFFVNENIVRGKTRIIPGSGINLEEHKFEEYPNKDSLIKFLFIGRIMKAKGIDELLEGARRIKDKYSNVQFNLIGFCEEDYSKKLEELTSLGVINYHGQQYDVHSFIKNSHATILPSYHEGTSNVLLESAACGRPVLASRVTGCVETFEEGISGIGFQVKSVDSLVGAIERFMALPLDKKRQMGIAGRSKMELEYDRKIIVNAYVEEINSLKEN